MTKANTVTPELPATPILDDTGLVERLRALEDVEMGGVCEVTVYRNPDGPEAADRILALSADNARKDATIAALRETVVDLWHDSNAGHGALHECLGMSWAEYQEWVTPRQALSNPLEGYRA